MAQNISPKIVYLVVQEINRPTISINNIYIYIYFFFSCSIFLSIYILEKLSKGFQVTIFNIRFNIVKTIYLISNLLQ